MVLQLDADEHDCLHSFLSLYAPSRLHDAELKDAQPLRLVALRA